MSNVNLKKLSTELNLSISTVSKALRDSYEISPETKKRVRELAEKLNYEPNPYASSLRKHKSKTIAIVVPEVANNFFSLAINGVESIAQEKGYHVLIYLTHEDLSREISICNHLQNGRVDGILISLSAETKDISHIEALSGKGVSLVFFDRIRKDLGSSTVTTDDFESGLNATQHLIDAGCKKIGYLSVSRFLSIDNERFKGYQEALAKNGIKSDPKLVIPCGNDNDGNVDLITRLLRGKNRPDGVFASVEKLAICTYQACEKLNLNIPRDVKLISFSNLEIAGLLNPGLTTITQPAFEIGKQAALQLFKSIEKKNWPLPQENLILKSRLIPRGSTGKG